METTEREIPGHVRHSGRPGFRSDKRFIAPADQILFRLRAESRSQNDFIVPEPGFGGRDLDDRTVGITQIDRVEILAIVRTRDMQPTICETPLPLQQSIPGGNVERKMVVRSGSPAPFWIADPGRRDTRGSGPGINKPGFRHHVEQGIPFDVADGVSPLRLPFECLKSEGDNR